MILLISILALTTVQLSMKIQKLEYCPLIAEFMQSILTFGYQSNCVIYFTCLHAQLLSQHGQYISSFLIKHAWDLHFGRFILLSSQNLVVVTMPMHSTFDRICCGSVAKRCYYDE